MGTNRALRIPATYALSCRINQRYRITLAAAIFSADNLPHELYEFVHAAMALFYQFLPEIQCTATSATPLLHQLEQSIMVKGCIFSTEEVSKELAHGTGI